MIPLVASAFALDRIATVHLGVGLPDMLGGGVSLTLARPLEVEVGGATGIIYTTAFARAGAALPLYDGDKVLIEGLALGGYRYLTQSGNGKHGAELDVAAELSWWLAPHFALDVQVLLGGGTWIGSQPSGVAPFLDGRFAVGVAF